VKEYPSIEYFKMPDTCVNLPCLAFEKLDGSNLRFEWNRKRGWYKFGTRHRLFDKSDSVFGRAIEMFLSKYDSILAKTVCRQVNVIAFCEFLGKHSFAGHHRTYDEFNLVLIDVSIHKQGIVSPYDFVIIYWNKVEIPKFLYDGRLTEEFVEDVKQGKYNVNEGVVIKGGRWMRKVKTNAWLARIKDNFPD
jgi:hypothetical protein